jgi:importin subunit beta-1
MCEVMPPDQVEKGLVDQILNTIVDGMRDDRPNEMKLAAINAMCNSLNFTETNFEIQAERNHIMNAICSATQCNEVKVRIGAFECLATVACNSYDKLPEYIDHLFQLTIKAIKADDQSVGQQAIEFWSTVCDTESQFVADIRDGEPPEEGVVYYRIIAQAARGLVPELLETLLKQSDTGSDDSWNIAMAGAACLKCVAQTIEDDVVELVLPFVTSNINSTLWRAKDAAIMAFGSILDGPSPERLGPIVVGALPHMIGCVRDPHPMVRDTSVWTIGRICEFHIHAISAEMIVPMVSALTVALDDTESKVAAEACYAFYNMAVACEDSDEANSNVLSSFMQQVLLKLLMVTNREDWEEDNLRSQAYEAVNMLVTNSAMDMQPVVLMLLAEALNRLEASWATNSDAHEKMNLQAQLCALIGVCVQKLPEDQLTAPTTDRTMTQVQRVFQIKGAVAHEDAFMAIGYLAGKMGTSFGRYADFLMPAVLTGLKNIEEHSVVTVASGVVGDLCRALGKQMLTYSDDIMRCLLELLQSQTVNRDVKPHIISLFADVAMALEGDFERYSIVVLNMLTQAGQMNIKSDDDDLIDYVNSLRESILDAYTGIIQVHTLKT